MSGYSVGSWEVGSLPDFLTARTTSAMSPTSAIKIPNGTETIRNQGSAAAPQLPSLAPLEPPGQNGSIMRARTSGLNAMMGAAMSRMAPNERERKNFMHHGCKYL